MESFETTFESKIPDPTLGVNRPLSSRIRSKTSQRLKYEAETQVFKRDFGSLEELRIKLGFSRRKICQILMVDPSAWTRWTQEDADAPPHIYQALKWYLDSKTNQNRQFEGHFQELKAANSALNEKIERLQAQQNRMRVYGFLITILLAAVMFCRWMNLI